MSSKRPREESNMSNEGLGVPSSSYDLPTQFGSGRGRRTRGSNWQQQPSGGRHRGRGGNQNYAGGRSSGGRGRFQGGRRGGWQQHGGPQQGPAPIESYYSKAMIEDPWRHLLSQRIPPSSPALEGKFDADGERDRPWH